MRPAPPARAPSVPAGVRTPEDERLRSELLRALEEHKGNVTEIARAMGKARMQIQRWIKRYGLR